MAFVEKVAAKASTISLARLLLSVLAAPFYVVGLVLGCLLVASRWAVAAVQVGVGDVHGER